MRTAFFAPVITATKTDARVVDADGNGVTTPGDTLEYTVAITNTGDMDATNVQFTDTIDINTTLVAGSIMTTPIAFPDSFSALGNVRIQHAAPGLLANDFDPDTGGNTGLTASGPATSANGGNVVVNANGSFSYNPAPGFEGTDTFTYTITDATGNTDTATVTITVNEVIWFINAAAAAGGDGRLTSPFNAIVQTNSGTVTAFSNTALDEPGDIIFVYSANYTNNGTLVLLNDQKLVGQQVTLQTSTGIVAPPGSDPLPPATPATQPAMTSTANGVQVAMNNKIHSITIGNTAGVDLTGSGFGTLNINNVQLTDTGRVLDLTNGTLTGDTASQATFAPLRSTSSSGGPAIRLQQVAGSLTTSLTEVSNPSAEGILVTQSTANMTFNNTTITGGTDAISLDNNTAGTRSFGTISITTPSGKGFEHINGGGTVSVSGATTITNPGGIGIDVQNSNANLTFAGVTVNKGSTAGTGVNLANNATRTIAFNSLTITTSNGTGLLASGGGTINVTTQASSSITSTGGPSVNATGITSGMAFNSLSSTNSTGKGLHLNGLSGTFASTTTTTTNPTGIGVHVLNSAAGSTTNLGNTAATQSASTGVRLETNNGSTTFADLNITPDVGQRAFHATNGTGTITTTSGTILADNAVGVEIVGASAASKIPLNMTLTSVTSDNGANGIKIKNTAGTKFEVVGGAGAGSGGTINNSVGADLAEDGNGIFLQDTQNITLNRMQINDHPNHAIRGITVSGFNLTNSVINGTNGTDENDDESSVHFTNLTGAANITSTSISGGREDNVRVINNTGTLNRLIFDVVTIGANNATVGGDGILIDASGTAVVNVTFEDGFLTSTRQDHLQFNLSNTANGDFDFLRNAITNAQAAIAGAGGISLTAGGAGSNVNFTYNVSNNTFRDSRGSAIFIAHQVATTGLTSGTVANNTIGVLGTDNSGSQESTGIDYRLIGGITMNATITGNTIREYNSKGISIQVGNNESGGNGFFNATISGNTINNPGSIGPAGGISVFGIELNSGPTGTDQHTTCFDLLNNNITGSGVNVLSNVEANIRQRAATRVNLPGYTGAAFNTNQVQTYFEGRDISGTYNVSANNSGTTTNDGYFNTPGGANCTPGAASVDNVRAASATGAQSDSEAQGISTPVNRDTLYAPDEAGPGAGPYILTKPDLAPLVQAAIDRWKVVGVTGADLAKLESLKIEIADLDPGKLVETTPEGIIIDRTASQYGWFLDSSASDESEYENEHDQLMARHGSAAVGRIDVITAVSRAMGFVLEHENLSRASYRHWYRQNVLAPSFRRVPTFKIDIPSQYVFPQSEAPSGVTGSAIDPSGAPAEIAQVEIAPVVEVALADYEMPGGINTASAYLPETPQVDEPVAAYTPVPAVFNATDYNLADRARTASFEPAASPMAGETVTRTIGTLPQAKTVTIKFRVTINSPLADGICTITNQGTVTADGPISVLTDDPDVAGTNNPTVTQIVTPPTISCPSNISVNAAANMCSASVTYLVEGDGCPVPTVTCVDQNNVSVSTTGQSFPVGVTTVTCTANNGSGTTPTCTFTVTVNDVTPPSITCPANITTDTDPGVCTAIETFTPTTSDNCPLPPGAVVCTPSSGTAFPKGTTTVNCVVTDAAGLTANCSFTVTVNDVTPPVITCPANVTVGNDPNACTAVVNYPNATATDNCTGVGTPVCTPAPGFAFPIGTTTVNCTVSDASGNPANCSFTVTVTDTTNPVLTCPSNITQGTDNNLCTAVVNYPAPTVMDNCSGSITPVCTPAAGTAFPKGTTTVNCTATDPGGNTGTCSFTITINDTQNPSITCPANITVGTDAGVCTAVVNYPAPMASDNCPLPPGAVVCTPSSGTAFPKGTTTVNCTITDGAGLTANCSFTVTVNDVTPPVITCPAPITVPATTGQCQAVVNYTVTATDNCPGVGTPVCTPASGSAFPAGTTTVNCSVSDASGNPASCSFTVTVTDATQPVLTCPANITVGTDAGVCTAVVNYPAPTVMDNCSGSITPVCTPAAGTAFPKGTTTVNCTATDPGGNTGTCSFTITVNDTTNPVITCPANVTQSTDPNQCQAVVNYPNATATDNCPGVGTPVCTPASGTAFPKGTTTVNCTVSDASGNSANCSFTVTVNDTQNPTITCPANVTVPATTGQCQAVVNYPNATATDNCTGVGTPVCSPAAGTAFPVGTTTVNCTVSDASGNSANCSFTVTVQDTQNPTITCPSNITVPTANQCEVVNYPPPTTSDNCPLPMNSVICNPPSGFCFPVGPGNTPGTTTVNCTVTDASGNMASCSFTVTIVPCIITCPANITQGNTPGQCGATINYPAPTTQGGCGTVTCSPTSGSFFPVGTTTVNCTTQTGPACSFTITINDTEDPNITCPSNVSQGTDPNQCQAVVNYPAPTATDNCPLGGGAVVCSPASGSVFPKGTTTVNCTVTDAAGRTDTCSFTVTVNDTQPPVITCPANITVSTANNQCQATVNYPNATATDNCSGVGTPVCTPASGSVFQKGTTTVNCTVSDSSGNQNSCSFTVTVNDTQNPVISCSPNKVKSTDPNMCSAVVNYTTTATDNCPGVMVVCNPPSGSAFPKGTTTVNCTATDTSGNTASCSFTVTVNDTQPPTIVCPSNITAITPAPGNMGVVVTYPNPVVTDNCPLGPNPFVCNPPSGSTFPLGNTTVTCTATDTSGNMSTCTFVVTTFDVCLEDNGNPGNVLLFNSVTGDYLFCCASTGVKVTGKGTLTKKGSDITLTHNPSNRRVSGKISISAKTGTASLQMPPGTNACMFSDSNTANNSCVCNMP